MSGRGRSVFLLFEKLQIEVLVVLGGMGDGSQLSALLALHLDEVLDQLYGEDTGRGQIVVIGLESVESFLQRGGQTLQLRLFFFRQVVEVHIIGTPAVGMRIDLVLHAVQTGHEDGGIAEVGVAGGVGLRSSKRRLLGDLA